MSYALDSKETRPQNRVRDFNHFVIFNPHNLLACHDYEYIDLNPDILSRSCHSSYNESTTTSFVTPDGEWHHLAVTWDGKRKGNTKIYKNGMLVAEAVKGNSGPLKPDGALVLGADQDCFGGCTEVDQGFFGMMDEVRIWKKVRTQDEIIRTMRTSDVVNDNDLVAYWKFDDPDKNPQNPESYTIARDSSKYGNDLHLRQNPIILKETISSPTSSTLNLETKAISFNNNYAMKADYSTMPTGDFTIEFWARTSALNEEYAAVSGEGESYAEFFSFASIAPGDDDVTNDGDGIADTAFIDDAIRIDRYMFDFIGSPLLEDLTNKYKSTKGSISLHINANREGNGDRFDNWIDYRVGWVDSKWHHLAVSWEFKTGLTQFWFDGQLQVPFWVSDRGIVSDVDPSKGGVDPHIGARTLRSSTGSLVLGQNQECFAGCFSPMKSYDGDMAVLRIWDRVLDTQTIKNNMFVEMPADSRGLVSLYNFRTEADTFLYDKIGGQHLMLGAEGPQWEFSSAPLTDITGNPLAMSGSVSSEGYALRLTDRQVLMLTDFQKFPDKQLTLEFWMWSTDSCRRGAPFSYAAGDYRLLDNAFLLFNYNDWGVSVMEDEGKTGSDHDSGIFATDGRWHFIAVSWESDTGRVRLYQDGKLVWVVQRAKGKSIPQGGILVIGREQDCSGGCFDSAEGAVGPTQTTQNIEHGDQDFYGIIDEMRLWNFALVPDQVHQNYHQDLGVPPSDEKILDYESDKRLVAHWKFDEGKGYKVGDVTGNGHDLYILQHPQWVPVSWAQTKRAEVGVCGNGVLEATEGCDDGLKGKGEGCDEHCMVVEGYRCNDQSPTQCYKSNNVMSNLKSTVENYVPSSSQSKQSESKSGAGGTIAIILIVIIILVVGVVLFIKRDWILRSFSSLQGRSQLSYHPHFDAPESTPLESVQYTQLSPEEGQQQQS